MSTKHLKITIGKLAVIVVIGIACLIGVNIVRTSLGRMDNSVDSREEEAEKYIKGLDQDGKPLDRKKLTRGKLVFESWKNRVKQEPGDQEAKIYYYSNEYGPSSYAEQLKDPGTRKKWKEQNIERNRERSKDDVKRGLKSLLRMVIGMVIFAIVGSIYFLPTIIAKRRKKDNLQAIFVCNLFTFVFVIPWFIAMVWAFTEEKKSTTMPPPVPLERGIDIQIRRLHDLKVEGILSEEEFEKKKKAILEKV